MKRFAPLLILIPFLLSGTLANAQTSQDGPTTLADGPLAPILANLLPRQLGPTTMGGRVVDISVFEKDPRIFFVASASGGLWRTQNLGTTFEPIFDREASVSLGSVAVSQKDSNLIWVGTGEHTSRNSVAWGDGVYKTTDGGKTWKNMGLKATQFISKVIIDPKDNNIVYVAALGKLWGFNEERGIYKTTDGGLTWNKVLSIDEKTGFGALEMDPSNPNVLLAAAWPRLRKAYDFSSGGPTAGLYKTTDGGKKWKKITKGLPDGPLGRIGLSFGRSNSKVIVATIEYKPLESEKDRVKEGRAQVLTYAGGTFRSEDGGDSWTRVNYLNPRPFYFSNPRVDPLDPQTVYVAATDLRVSTDGGKTFKVSDNRVHPDYHAFWIDPTNSNTLLVGTDGGVFLSHDKGAKWRHLNGLVIGQYYAVAADNRRPYWIWGGLQDNQSWGIPTQGRHAAVNFYDTENLGGGDGFYAQVDPEDWSTVYWESQGGSISRTDLKTGRSRGIGPRQTNIPLRFNWSTPFIISPHNAKTLYLGSNVLFKSINRGDSWRAVSPDLTTNDPAKQKAGASSVTPEDTGAERHCTIVTLGESPARAGILWVGTDDGLVHVSQDDGVTWTNVTSAIPDLPANLWCTRVLPSRYAEGRAYVTFSGHRSDDFRPYVYVTEDFGKTWSKLSAGLPEGDSVYAIQEGRQNPDLLFLGSEMSLRVSLDRGRTWTRFRTNFPTVAVHDLLIHPRELDLIIGTHGRSIWTLDVSALEQLTAEARSADAAVFKPQDVLLLGRSSSQSQWIGDDLSGTRNTQPGTTIYFHLKTASDVKLSIFSTSGEDVNENTISGKAGLNAFRWNGRIGGILPPPGSYKVVLTVNGKEYVTTATVAGVSGSSGADAPENDDEDGK